VLWFGLVDWLVCPDCRELGLLAELREALFGSELPPVADWLPDAPVEGAVPLWLERPAEEAAGELDVLEGPGAGLSELDLSDVL